MQTAKLILLDPHSENALGIILSEAMKSGNLDLAADIAFFLDLLNKSAVVNVSYDFVKAETVYEKLMQLSVDNLKIQTDNKE